MIGLIGRKIGMTQIYRDDGVLCPSTIIEAAGDAVGLPNNVPGRPGKTVGNSEVGTYT